MIGSRIHGLDVQQLRQFTGSLDAHAGARLFALGDGAERGLRVVELRSGSGMEVEVLVDSSGDLGRLNFKGKTLSWHSPSGARAPWLMNLEGDQGQGFLQGVGGLLNTCGLDHIRQPEYSAVRRTPPDTQKKSFFPLHGKGAFQPARLTGYGMIEDACGPTIFCTTEFTQPVPLVTTLRLRRRVELPVGSDQIKITDIVDNIGGSASSHMMLYHFNLGFPFIAPGTRLSIPGAKATWHSHDHDPLGAFVSPKAQRCDQLSLFKMPSDKAELTVTREDLGLSLSIRFDPSQLPYCQILKMMAPAHYGLGVEPCTTGQRSRQAAEEHGEMVILESGDSRTYQIFLEISEL